MKKVHIHGVSGRFPESQTVEEFAKNLFEGRDMVTSDSRRWDHVTGGPPASSGKIPLIEEFDASFFGVHAKQASSMDPQLRILLEASFEALCDAKISPLSLRGSSCGVYMGSCFSDAHELFFTQGVSGYENTGCAQSMFANRISFFYDLHGPSMSLDTACSSGLVALVQAVQDLRSGRIDRAIVGGSSILLNPQKSKAFEMLKMLSPSGACRSFDASADGYVRSEAVAVLVLSCVDPLDTAYLEILGEGVNSDGFTPKGITFPSASAQSDLIESICSRSHIDPLCVKYVECHGTGTVAGDGEERAGLAKSYRCDSRTEVNPLYIGSVKSNMGHCEGGSGIVGLVKLCIAAERSLIPPNLHFVEPSEKLLGLGNRCQVVAKEPLAVSNGDVCAVSSFGFGGTNAHVVVGITCKGFSRSLPKLSRHDSLEPWLEVNPVFGRSEDGVEVILQASDDDAKFQIPLGPPLLNQHGMGDAYPYRGTSIQGSHVITKVDSGSAESRLVWFVFGGNGCQWVGMAKSLYECSNVFRKTLDACMEVGRTVGIDLASMLLGGGTSSEKFGPAHGDMGLTAVQISLVAMMRHAGLKCAGTIGHSAGETVCGYVDGCCTLEQAMLISHARATCVVDFPDILGQGMMAAVGLDRAAAEAIVKPYWPDVVVGCHNSLDGVTLSGKSQVLGALLEDLKKKGIFVRQVETRGMAFHSPMLKPALTVLRERLSQVLPDPVPRSSTWVSSCFLDEDSNAVAKTLSAEYHVHNFSNPVEFVHALNKVPPGAVLLELSPHAILANPIRRTRTDISYVGLMKMGESGEETVRQAMAQLWNLGLNFLCEQVNVIERSLLRWDRQNYPIPRYGSNSAGQSGAFHFKYDMAKQSSYMLHHNIDGRPLMPAASYLCTVWSAFAEFKKKPLLSVRLCEVKILQAIQIDEVSVVTLDVLFGGGPRHYFELNRGDEKVVTGSIEVISEEDVNKHVQEADTIVAPSEAPSTDAFTRSDVYALLARSGYNYGPNFQGVSCMNATSRTALLCNQETEGMRAWIPYIDSLLHLAVLEKADGKLRVPVCFRQVDIFATSLRHSEPALVRRCGDIVSRQVVIKGMQTDVLSRKGGTSAASSECRTIASLLDFVKFGEVVVCHDDKNSTIDKYCAALTQALHERLSSENLLRKKPHLVGVCALLENLPPVVERMDLVAIAKDPDAIWLRMILDLLAPETVVQTLEAPIQAIVKHPEHGVLYQRDIALGMPLYLIERTLHLVEENVGDLLVAEIGCGTCGLTRGIVRRPSIRRYLATDVSPAFLSNIDTVLGGSDLVEKGLWDVSKPLSAELLKGNLFNLIVASNALHTANNVGLAIENACLALQDHGFLLAYEWTSIQTALFWGLDESCWKFDRSEGRKYSLWTTSSHWIELFNAHGMQLVQHIRYGDASVLLARKRSTVCLTHKVIKLSNDLSSSWMAEYLAAVGSADRLWLVGRNAGLPGLVRCLNKEPRLMGTRAIVLSESDEAPHEMDSIMDRIRSMDMLVNHVNSKGDEIGCYIPSSTKEKGAPVVAEGTSRVCAVFPRPGDLSCIEWLEITPSRKQQDSELDCRIHYSALNFKDVMLASGKLNVDAVSLGSTKNAIGFEFSGVIEGDSNRRVMGFGKQTFATHVQTTPSLLFDVPEHWSLLEASTVPTVYATVYYSLFVCGGFVGKGQSVLIHAGAGGVGQAAIRIALNRGAEVFTTCSSSSKREWLLREFAGLKADHIGSSRDPSFEEVVMQGTNGAGVDLVLNSLSGELLFASIRCLRQHGRFLEIGKYDMMKDTRIGMQVFLKNCSFFGIDVSQVFDMPLEWKKTRELMIDGIRRGEVAPLPTHVFRVDEISQAFQFMASGKHTGKVVVSMESIPIGAPLMRRFVVPQSSGTYLVVGGLGGVGLELCKWLADRGALEIIVTSRRGVTSAVQALTVKEIVERGVRFSVSTLDCSSETQCRELLAGIPCLLGVFHLAMVLQDSLLQNMTPQQWDACVLPKAKTALLLDAATRGREECKMFVMFSSVSSGLGNAGQSNYGFGNSWLEEVCRNRVDAGFHALAIQWGMIGDVGYVANLSAQGKGETVSLHGRRLLPQPILECLNVMERWLVEGAVGVASSYKEKLRSGGSVNVLSSLTDRIASALGVTAEKLDTAATFRQLGCDSIQIVEIQSLVETATNTPAIPLEKLMTMRVSDVLSL